MNRQIAYPARDNRRADGAKAKRAYGTRKRIALIAGAFGAYALSESYLYTLEAVKDFYSKLEEGGYVNYSRFLLSNRAQPRETLRLANIAYTALSELGIENPASHLAVLQGNNWASTMIKRGPFTEAEITALRRFAEEQGFVGLLFDPLRPRGEAAVPQPCLPRAIRDRRSVGRRQ